MTKTTKKRIKLIKKIFSKDISDVEITKEVKETHSTSVFAYLNEIKVLSVCRPACFPGITDVAFYNGNRVEYLKISMTMEQHNRFVEQLKENGIDKPVMV